MSCSNHDEWYIAFTRAFDLRQLCEHSDEIENSSDAVRSVVCTSSIVTGFTLASLGFQSIIRCLTLMTNDFDFLVGKGELR